MPSQKSIRSEKMPLVVKKYIEHVLYSHKEEKTRYERMREEAKNNNGGPALVDVPELLYLGIRVKGVERTLKQYSVLAQLYELIYCQKLHHAEVCERLNISMSTYRKFKNALIRLAGENAVILW